MLPKNVDDAYPLSPMQHLMLLHAIASAGNGVLLNQVCYDIRGSLDADAFHRAWDAVVARHPALRTAFLWEGLPQPLQVVRTSVTLPFREVDLADASPEARAQAIETLRRENADAPMTLGKAPLMRCTLIRLAPEHHYFLWAVHHLVVDRWSHAVLFGDLRTLYAAYVHGETPKLGRVAAYKRYIEWGVRQDRAVAERFWRAELAGVHAPLLLAGDGISTRRSQRLTTSRRISREATTAVRERAARWRTTPGAVLLSAIGLTIASRTGRDDVVYGVTVAGRPPDLPEAETTVGSFVNNLPARLVVQRHRAVDDWVRGVQQAQARRQTFAHVSLTDIQSWSDVPPARPLFDTLVLLNLTDESDGTWPGIELVADAATLDAGYPLLLSVTTDDDRFVFTLVHDASFMAAEELLADLEASIARVSAAEPGALVSDVLPAAAVPRATRALAAAPAQSSTADSPRARVTTADALLHAWREVLGIDGIGLDDDFFALGGTSLQAAQLFVRVERIAGRMLPLSTLFGASSVRALLAEIDRPLPRSGSLVRIRSSGTHAPLYAVPGIGGNVVGLAGLARALGPDQPFGAFESPGLDGCEPPLTSIEAIAERYAQELAREETRSFHLIGLCWGAAVGFEMARKLVMLGRAPTSVALIDPAVLLRETDTRSPRAEATFLRSRLELYWDEFREGDWRDRTRMLANKAKRAAKLLTGSEALRQSQGELNRLRVQEANRDAILRYAPARLEARARIFITADRDVGSGDDPRLEWLTLVDPTPDVVPIAGSDSGDAISPAHVGGLADTLHAWLCVASDIPSRPPATQASVPG